MNILPPDIALLGLQAADRQLMADIKLWLPVLYKLSVTAEAMRKVTETARRSGRSFETELVFSGCVAETALYRALADTLGLEFIDRIEVSSLIARETDAIAMMKANKLTAFAALGAPSPVLLIAPSRDDLPRLRVLARSADATARICITTPSAMRTALAALAAPKLSQFGAQGLYDSAEQFSARVVMSTPQAILCGMLMAILPLLIWFFPFGALVTLHIIGTGFFVSCAGLRTLAAAHPSPASGMRLRDPPLERPVYSVLVALYREREIVPQLLRALSRLQWPRDKLEIKLICEADDLETIEAIRAHELRTWVDIVIVPRSRPRTKPKALRYALPLTNGEFIVLFDAEDKPHPMQLEEAWRRFSATGDELACLQAPLDIVNGGKSSLSAMFAFEYSGLFRGFLPWLARIGPILPLGGTSNHFRRSALEESGGWDPHNVTEDADIGVRLVRLGYRLETIGLPTQEQAPEALHEWMPQRTRWLKGWMQSWLVHMRDPVALYRDLGGPAFVLTQLLLAGAIVSVLLHPVIFITALVYGAILMSGDELGILRTVMFVIDVANLFISYASFFILGWRHKGRRVPMRAWRIALWTPLYWLLLSWAGWRALVELVRKPHHWNKTPHKPVGGITPAAVSLGP